ncbi:hypothetical protein BU15DRAFT_82572 [Melanogaster broomeanus]|nr:hypothetical protein BU15DRAFT_82572 [Melanogaster broomeanus]
MPSYFFEYAVFALYQGSYRYVAIGGVAILLEIITSAITNGIAYVRESTDGTCIATDTPLEIIPMMAGITISQSILLYLTYRGKPIVRSSNTARRHNIASILIRDGAFVFCSLICLVAMSFLYLAVDGPILNVLYPWFPTVPSIATSRMISNMQAAAEPTRATSEFTTEYTSPDMQLYPLSQAEGDTGHRDGQQSSS